MSNPPWWHPSLLVCLSGMACVPADPPSDSPVVSSVSREGSRRLDAGNAAAVGRASALKPPRPIPEPSFATGSNVSDGLPGSGSAGPLVGRPLRTDNSISSAPGAVPPAPPGEIGQAVTSAQAKGGARSGAVLTGVFRDAFEREELGPDYRPTSDVWHLERGRLCGSGARNHPVWLTRALPVNARIEFDAVSDSTEGDIKAEFWGDGRSQADGHSYGDATSYIAILGGWKNSKHLLARLDEHAPGQPSILVEPSGRSYRSRPVVANRTYHFKVERSDGRTVQWFVDDIELVSFVDPAPLKGPEHRFLGFNDWQVRLCFDNLKITPLPGE